MEEKNNKKTYLLITLGVLGAIVLTLGITYAYWRLTKEQTNENVVTTACLDVDIESEQDNILLSNAFPILDEDAESLVPFKFTIHNKCEDYANFQINLESMNREKIQESQRLNPKYLKFKLNEAEQTGITRLLTGSKEEDTTSVTPTIANAYDAHKLMSGYIEPNGSKNFEFRLWMDGEITAEEVDSMNKTFVSKISVTSTYLDADKIPPTVEFALSVCDKDITASITGKANGEKSIKKYEYKIDSNEWQDGSEVNEITNQSIGKHTIKARVTDNKGIVSEEVEQVIEIKEPENVEIAGKQVPIATCNNGLYKVEHNNLSELGSEWNKTEYRYAGASPDNYVEFNNEKWRIIGLVNVKTTTGVEQRIKIIRTKDVGTYAYDYYNSDNDWTKASLKDMLNGIYYNSESGKCYSAVEGEETDAYENECDFSGNGYEPKGLDEEARKMIDSDVIWNIGGVSDGSSAEMFYEAERGTITYESNPTEWTKENDSKYHNGVGLMYPSDYRYAVGGKMRNDCLLKSNYDCIGNNWFAFDSYLVWTLSSASSNYYSMYIDDFDNISWGYTSIGYSVFPTVYLTFSTTIYDGDGTFDNPYKLR